MKAQEFKTSINDVESKFISSTKSLEAQVEKLRAELRDLKQCIERKNKEIAELKNDQREFSELFEKITTMFDRQPQQKLLDELQSMEKEVSSLLEMARAEDRGASATSSSYMSSLLKSESLSDSGKEQSTKPDGLPSFGSIHLSAKNETAERSKVNGDASKSGDPLKKDPADARSAAEGNLQ